MICIKTEIPQEICDIDDELKAIYHSKDTNLKKALEWFGVITAIFYSMLVASNTGFEVLGFALLFISALAIGLWAFLCKHYGMLLLQFFYASAGLIGVVRWL